MSGTGRARPSNVAVLVGTALVALLVVVDTAFAQCAMCRTALEQNAELASGFNRGILLLLAMPYVVFGSIALSWYMRRRRAEKAGERAAAPEAQAHAHGRALGSEFSV